MNISIDHDIKNALGAIVERTPDLGLRPDEYFAPVEEPDRNWRPLFAIAAATVAIAGVGFVAANRASPDETDTSPAGQPVTTAPASNGNSAQSDIAFDAMVFPSASAEAINAAGYETPEAVVDAYMTARTAPAQLPTNYEVSFEIGQVQMVDPDTAVVWVGLTTPDDTGDLRVATQMQHTADGDRWWVTAAATLPGELTDAAVGDDRLTGSITAGSGGLTYIYAYDPITSELLGSTILDDPVATSAANVEPGQFEIALDGGPNDVLLRYWNVVATDGSAYQYANFGEVEVSFKNTGFGEGWNILLGGLNSERAPVLSEEPITTFENITGDSVVIVDDQEMSIVARFEPTTTAPYCVDLRLDGFSGPACVEATAVFDGRTSFAIPSGDGTRQLVGQIVTDLVDTVVASDGRTIIPSMNVWWDVTDIGSPITYVVQASNGRSTEPFAITAE